MGILSHPTWDIIVVLAFVAIGFFYGLSKGKQKIISTILFTYIALALQPILPVQRIQGLTGVEDLFLLRSGLFVVTVFLLLFILGGRQRGRSALRSSSWWQVFILAFVQAGLLIHIIFSFLPPDKVVGLAPLTRTVFANQNLHVWWLVGPLALLALLKKLGLREE